MFHRLSKHLEFRQKYSTARRIFTSLLCVWISWWNITSCVWYNYYIKLCCQPYLVPFDFKQELPRGILLKTIGAISIVEKFKFKMCYFQSVVAVKERKISHGKQLGKNIFHYKDTTSNHCVETNTSCVEIYVVVQFLPLVQNFLNQYKFFNLSQLDKKIFLAPLIFSSSSLFSSSPLYFP